MDDMTFWAPEPEYCQDARPLEELLDSVRTAIDDAPHDVLDRRQRAADRSLLDHLDSTTWPAADG
ncbi:hypothetical protein P3T36_002359 [Kitasatospora sp. MAP12-15]